MDRNPQILVSGAESRTPDRPPSPSGPRLFIGLMATGLAAGLLAAIGAGPDAPPTAQPVAPAPSTPVAVGAIQADRTAISGWYVVDLPGVGFVSDVVHGPQGWLAVADGESLIVYASPDATIWTARRLATASTDRLAARALVTADRMVVTATGGATTVQAWVAENGREWNPVPFPRDATSIRALTEIDDVVLAAGSRSTEVGEVAAIWALDSGRWRSIPLDPDPAAEGIAVGFVRMANATVAMGSDGQMAAWRLEEGRFVRTDLGLPADLKGLTPSDVMADAPSVLALVEGRVSRLGRGWSVLETTDFQTWQRKEPSVPFAIRLGRIADSPVVLGSDTKVLEVAVDGIVDRRGLPEALVMAATTADGITIAGGIGAGDLRPRLWVAGTSESPRVVRAEPDPDAQWRPVAEIPTATIVDHPVGWFEPPSAVATDLGDVFLATGGGPLIALVDGRVDDLGPDTTAVFAAGDAVWRIDPDGRPFRWNGDVWVRWRTPSAQATAIVELGGRAHAVTVGGAILSLDDGTPVGDLPTNGRVRSTSGGAVVVSRSEDGAAIVSADGVDWHVAGVAPDASSGEGFVVRNRTEWGAEVAVVTDWPAPIGFVLPDPDPQQVVVVGAEIRVLTPRRMLVSGDGGSTWEAAPLEPFMVGRMTLLPTAEPMVAVLAADGTTIYALSD